MALTEQPRTLTQADALRERGSMETLRDLFAHVVRTMPPDKILLRIKAGSGWRTYTTAQFAQATYETAGRLRQAGVGRGDRVALFCENRPEWHIVDFACHHLGAVTVSIYTTLPAMQVRQIVADCGAKVLLVAGKERARTAREAMAPMPEVRIIGIDPGLAEGLPSLQDFPLPTDGPLTELPPLSGQDLASIVYTSGTTGIPKGAMLSHRNFISQINTVRPLYPISEQDEVISFLPLAHVYERILDYVFLSCGCQITYVEPPERVVALITEIRPTIMGSFPALYERAYNQILSKVQREHGVTRWLFLWALSVGRRVREAAWAGKPAPILARLQYAMARKVVFSKVLARLGGRLRFSTSGGAPLAREAAEFFDIVGLPILNGYGLTESSPLISVNLLEHNKLGSVGVPAPGVEVRIAPDGEILARGPNIMLGYWNNPQATAEVIDQDGWLHTGDIGHLDADGFLFLTDRKKDLIATTGGKKVAPQPIEGRLTANPLVAQAVLIGDRYPYLTALIVPNFETLELSLTAQGVTGLSHEAMANHPLT
jgi:long-chain acyl-CoA synthetase